MSLRRADWERALRQRPESVDLEDQAYEAEGLRLILDSFEVRRRGQVEEGRGI